MKTCHRCNKTKALSAFSRRKGVRPGKDGRAAECVACSNKRVYRWRKDNPGKVKRYPEKEKARLLKKRYGITLLQYTRLLVEQGGGCAICGSSNAGKGRSMAVDHCHTTKRVRGLLRIPCNQGLGHFKDDSSLLRKAINYLK